MAARELGRAKRWTIEATDAAASVLLGLAFGSRVEGGAEFSAAPASTELGPCRWGKVREIEFFLESMESLVSNPPASSHGLQTLAARGEYFRPQRRRRPTIPFIRRSGGLA